MSQTPDPPLQPDHSRSSGFPPTLAELLEQCEPSMSHADAPQSSATILATIEETHSPELPGRSFASWTDARGETHRGWLARACAARPEIGDRVVLVRPANDPEWLITGIVHKPHERLPAAASEAGPTLALEPGKSMRILGESGQPLFELEDNPAGPVLRVLSRDLEVDVPGRLRLSADRLELRAGHGGIDLRTDSDFVARARFIRLN